MRFPDPGSPQRRRDAVVGMYVEYLCAARRGMLFALVFCRGRGAGVGWDCRCGDATVLVEEEGVRKGGMGAVGGRARVFSPEAGWLQSVRSVM